jgi:hypothetical protein
MHTKALQILSDCALVRPGMCFSKGNGEERWDGHLPRNACRGFIRYSLLILTTSARICAAEPPTLTVDRNVVELGQPFTLSWGSKGSEAYLLGYGPVKPSGSMHITPTASKTYTLIVGTKGQVNASSLKVTVAGEKGGGNDILGFDKFKTSIPGEEGALDYVEFLGRVETTLRDTNGFSVDGEFLPSRPYTAIYTDRREKEYLKSNKDRVRTEHRIAYCVFIYQPTDPPKVRFEVKALTESRPVAESEWQVDDDPELAESNAAKLRDQLLTGARDK